MVLHFRPGATWLLVLVLLAPPLWGHDEAALEAALESPGRHDLLLRPDPDLEIPLTVLVGSLPGRTLLILAGVHGAEYAPMVAAQRLGQDIDPRALHGRVIIAPIVNLPAFQGRSIYLNPQDGKNLNRVFPGDREGSASERLAAFLTSTLYPLADAVLDMHSGDGNEDLNPPWVGFYERAGSEDVIERSRALALAFGAEHVVAFQWRFNDPSEAIWAGSAAVAQGIPSIDVEAGGRNVVDPEAVAFIARGVRRVLAHLAVLPASFSPPSPPRIIRERRYLSAEATGVWHPARRAGEQVREGDLLGTLTDWHGRKLATLRAPEAGLVLLIMSAPPVSAGETLVVLAP